ncbi:MAG: hypothetical protein NZ556_09475 [Fimbriimonadales bacterium]|nr:hypothetical protein [Fimbriimonadales bacterium]
MQIPTPQQLMQQFAQKVARTRAYSYTWEFQERDEKTGKLGEKQIYKLEFLQPHYRKMTIIQRDLFSNGATVIYNPDVDKKVHARKGIIRREYETNDPEIKRFFETDLGSILKDLQRLFRGAAAEPVKRERQGQREVYLLRFAPKSDPVQRVSLTLDARDLMPLRIEYADAKGTRSLRVFTEYAFPNLKPDDFKF